MSISDKALSRAISHALRHEPWLYELELDDEGWTSVDALVCALRCANPEWTAISRTDIEQVIVRSDKKRHELAGDRIRALYGHSVPGRLRKEPAIPPPALFHGTSRPAAEQILREGLKPMTRQYVHLSPDKNTAEQVGRRKTANPMILKIHAFRAHTDGVAFYVGNDNVWLADLCPLDTSRVDVAAVP